eukprot:362479-Chlamydomonas_euryale.AAC.1
MCFAAYMFGRFGVAARSEVPLPQQSRLLSSKLPMCAASSRGAVLAALLRLYFGDPGNAALRRDTLLQFERHRGALDAATAARAAELLVAADQPGASPDGLVLMMPKWPERMGSMPRRWDVAHGENGAAPADALAGGLGSPAPTAGSFGVLGEQALLAAASSGASGQSGAPKWSAPVPAVPLPPPPPPRKDPVDLLSDLFADTVIPPAAPLYGAEAPLYPVASGPTYAAAAPTLAQPPVPATANPFAQQLPMNSGVAPPLAAVAEPTMLANPFGGVTSPQASFASNHSGYTPTNLGYGSMSHSSPTMAAPPPPPPTANAGAAAASAFAAANAAATAAAVAAAAAAAAPAAAAPLGFDDPFEGSAFAPPPPPPARVFAPVVVDGDLTARLTALMYRDRGVLYEDQYLQVGLMSSFPPGSHTGTLTLFLGNKVADAPLTNVSLELAPSPSVVVAASAAAPPTLHPKEQVKVPMSLTAVAPIKVAPAVILKYTLQNVAVDQPLTLPVANHRFVVPEAGVTKELFFEQWKSIRWAGRAAHNAAGAAWGWGGDMFLPAHSHGNCFAAPTIFQPLPVASPPPPPLHNPGSLHAPGRLYGAEHPPACLPTYVAQNRSSD